MGNILALKFLLIVYTSDMEKFVKEVQIRWSDLDPNFHVRHTSYYDFGTSCRIEFLERGGLKMMTMQKDNIGPILFREECVFKKEIMHEDKIFVELWVIKAKKDFSRWSIEHPIKKEDGSLAALLTIDGAFFDKTHRKLINPPSNVADIFSNMPKSDKFNWLD